jgi:methyltransferase OMS1, mitochondrial
MVGFVAAPVAARAPAPTTACSAPPVLAPLSRRAVLLSIVAAALPVPSCRSRAAAAAAADADAVARAYDGYSSRYDALDGASASLPRALGFAERRAAAVARAAGRTLEVACGTGANFPLYAGAPRVRAVVAVDLSEGMLVGARVARERVLAARPRPAFTIDVVRGDCAALAFPDEAFDTVLDTFSLCVLPDPGAALREMRRVLKRTAGARVLLVEHAVSDCAPLALYQNATAPVVAGLAKGCFWNQDVVGLARQAGLRVVASSSGLAGTVVSLELCRDDAALP